MAKSVKERLESQMRQPVQPPAVAEVVAPVATIDRVEVVEGVKYVTITVPFCDLPTHVNQGPFRCDVRLTRDQANVFRRLALGMDRTLAVTSTGRRITSWHGAVLGLADCLCDAMRKVTA